MSKSNSAKSAVPAAPTPASSNYYENDFLRSSSAYDKKTNTYTNTSFTNPTEKGLESQATDYMGKLVHDLPNAVNLSPEAIGQYRDAYEQPQIHALNDSYNQAKGNADMMASGSGMKNSVGFGHYTANEIEKNRAQGLADIAANGKMMEYDLPNKVLSPYVNQFNLYNAALGGQQASMAQDLEPTMNLSQAGNNFALQNYQNQQAAYQQNNKRGGLFSFFTGG